MLIWKRLYLQKLSTSWKIETKTWNANSTTYIHKEKDLLEQDNEYMKQTQTLRQRTHKEKELLKQENSWNKRTNSSTSNTISSNIIMKKDSWNKRYNSNKQTKLYAYYSWNETRETKQTSSYVSKRINFYANNTITEKNFWNKWYKSNDSTLRT